MDARIMDMLKKFLGKPPYDGPSNIVRGDGYFALQIERESGKKLKELLKEFDVPHRAL